SDPWSIPRGGRRHTRANCVRRGAVWIQSRRRPTVHISRLPVLYVICGALAVAGCVKQAGPGAATKITKIEPGEDAQKRVQTALINAKPGAIIELGAGKFEFSSTVSCDVSDITIRGQGSDKTILNFKQQAQGTGGEGLSITGKNKVTIEDLAV